MKAKVKYGVLISKNTEQAQYEVSEIEIESPSSFNEETNEEIWQPLLKFVLEECEKRNWRLFAIDLLPSGTQS